MIHARCVDIIRDKNKIVAYNLVDNNGKLVTVESLKLKDAIINNKITVSNLKLTSDSKLIQTKEKEKQVQEREKQKMINDPYLEEVIETQGILFEEVVYAGGDLVDFANKYMNSNLKHIIDDRGAWHTNLLYKEQLEELEKEGIKPIKSTGFNDYMIANWIGEFYATLQWYTQMYSSFVIKLVPIKELIVMSRGLHDLDMELAVKRILQNRTICFHNPDEPNAYLSNWFHSEFKVSNITFDSMEQYMMWSKAKLFKDDEVAKKIMETTDFGTIKKLGRQVRNFDNNLWDEKKEEIIYKGLYAKFSQNKELSNQLKSTDNYILAECAAQDKIWAIGMSMTNPDRFYPVKWQGQNLLGKLLMKVRDNLK